MNQHITIEGRTLHHKHGKYTVRKQKVVDIEIDVQQERTGVKINYSDRIDPAFIFHNPTPCAPDYALLSEVVEAVYHIDRSTYRSEFKVLP